MKKIVSTFILIFIVINSFSQEKLNTVTYKITNNIVPTEKQKNSIHAESINNIFREMEKLEYVLHFNLEESLFKEIKKMIINEDDNSFSISASKILGGVEGLFYRNKKTKEVLYQKESFSKLFLIDKSNTSENWTLIKKTKKIGNYSCYKATTTETYLGRSGLIKKRSITAWYALDIPVPFGPLNYGDLPGLILELEKGKFVYYATSIKLNQDLNLKIEKPNKGQKVTQKEYDSITKKLIDTKRGYLSKN